MKKIKLLIILILCCGLLAGCDMVFFQNGGTSNKTNYTAPKHIDSRDLLFFETSFYRKADFVYDKERMYHFKLEKNDNGVFEIYETRDSLKCETDEEFVKKLEQLIRDYKLIESNGLNKETYGLPQEYAPYWLEAKYSSNERLYFYVNGDPYADWTFAVLDLFAKEFGVHDVDNLLPKKEDSIMTRFSLEYTFGELKYIYGEILVPNNEQEANRTLEDVMTNGFDEANYVKKVYYEIWNRNENRKISEDIMVDITSQYYEELQKIVEQTELLRFHNGQIFPPNFDYKTTPQYYEFYIEYESGKVMCGFSDDEHQCEKFKEIVHNFSSYYEEYVNSLKQ